MEAIFRGKLKSGLQIHHRISVILMENDSWDDTRNNLLEIKVKGLPL